MWRRTSVKSQCAKQRRRIWGRKWKKRKWIKRLPSKHLTVRCLRGKMFFRSKNKKKESAINCHREENREEMKACGWYFLNSWCFDPLPDARINLEPFFTSLCVWLSFSIFESKTRTHISVKHSSEGKTSDPSGQTPLFPAVISNRSQ